MKILHVRKSISWSLGQRRFAFLAMLRALTVAGAFFEMALSAHAQTANGEIEGRPSPTFRRICQGGTSAGKYCKQNSECPGSTCSDRNVFNITVAILYDAPAADITTIQNMISGLSATLLDVTDGQAQIGTATIHNNAITSNQADLEIHPSTNDVWWVTNTGNFRTGGLMSVSINRVQSALTDTGTDAGTVLTHEFAHLVFDPRDEYESRPAGCVNPTSPNEDCPVPAAGDGTCLMDGNGTEFCWGQANSANLTDLTGGNHDPTNVTEQSVCRSNRSCWDQLVWSWPTTFLMPTGAPDPGTNGVVVNPSNFIISDNDVRAVLVLDESGSMSLESPSRIERLKVAAGDFIATAQNDTQLGLQSFATDAETASGRASVAIAALGANRSTWTNGVNGLTPSTRTNIGAGLQKAKDMIVAAGGVTANTYIVLMTDGLNNEPAPDSNAAADLQAKINDLLASGIPVFITCTGGDLGLQSQCSEIAAGTNGFYSDSADPSRMPQNFVDFQERMTGHQGVSSVEGNFSKMHEAPATFYIDEFSESASFSLLWENAAAGARATLIDPAGTTHQMQPIPQGLYARISKPIVGEWKMRIDPTGQDSRFVARAYVLNRINNLVVSIRWPTRKPGEEIYVFAFPKSRGGPITQPGAKLTARVSRPDGSTDTLDLFDNGRDAPNHGDDLPGDGIFTGVYKNTALKGAYGFQVSADIDKWHLGSDAHERNERVESPRFMREQRVSAAVGEPGDKPKEPEDGRTPTRDFCTICCWLALVFLFLLLVALLLLWRCCWSKRALG
jgi:von Willebrand factor type A domain